MPPPLPPNSGYYHLQSFAFVFPRFLGLQHFAVAVGFHNRFQSCFHPASTEMVPVIAMGTANAVTRAPDFRTLSTMDHSQRHSSLQSIFSCLSAACLHALLHPSFIFFDWPNVAATPQQFELPICLLNFFQLASAASGAMAMGTASAAISAVVIIAFVIVAMVLCISHVILHALLSTFRQSPTRRIPCGILSHGSAELAVAVALSALVTRGVASYCAFASFAHPFPAGWTAIAEPLPIIPPAMPGMSAEAAFPAARARAAKRCAAVHANSSRQAPPPPRAAAWN